MSFCIGGEKKNTITKQDKKKEKKEMKLVLLGFGAVGKTIVEMLPLTGWIPEERWKKGLVIIEPKELGFAWLLESFQNVQHLRVALTPENVDTVLDGVLSPNDTLLDCSVNVDALRLMAACAKHGVLYINTSMEEWATPNPHVLETSPKALFDRSLYARILLAREQFKDAKNSMLVDFGCNPGIISLFVLKALRMKCVGSQRAEAFFAKGDFASAAKVLGLRLIHITEHDTQKDHISHDQNTFYNTWSSEGLIAEALDPVQIGFGTHEPERFIKPPIGPQNVRILPVRGMDLQQCSVSPARDGSLHRFIGFSIPHGESNTISATLTTSDYRPTVSFVYRPCSAGREGLRRMKTKTQYRKPEHLRVFTQPELRRGYDAVGATLFFRSADQQDALWCGTILDVKDMAPLGIRLAGPTTVQVGVAMLTAWRWMIKNPHKGLLMPEDLPLDEILPLAEPWLGRTSCQRIPLDLFAPRTITPNLLFSDFVLQSVDKKHVIIVGAGFAGLYAAFLLRRLGISVTILERRSIVGGKARTVVLSGNHGRYELGPSVFHTLQKNMMHLVKHCGLKKRVLKDCEKEPVSKERKFLRNKAVQDVLDVSQMREGDEIAHMNFAAWESGHVLEQRAELCTFVNGWQSAAKQIWRNIKEAEIFFDQEVLQIKAKKNEVEIVTTKSIFHGSHVIVATSFENVPEISGPTSSFFLQANAVARSVATLRVYVEFQRPLPKDFPADLFEPFSQFRWCVKINDFVLLLSYTDDQAALDRFRTTEKTQREFVITCLREVGLQSMISFIQHFHFADWKHAFTILQDVPLSPTTTSLMHRITSNILQTFLPHPSQQAWTEAHLIQAASCVSDILCSH